jgi:hypothetical protein
MTGGTVGADVSEIRALGITPGKATMAGKLATIFDKVAQWTAKQCGKAHTFAIAVVILWGG